MVYSHVPQGVLKLLPAVRVVAICREPLDRFWSSYHYNYLEILGGGGSARRAGPEHFVEVGPSLGGCCTLASTRGVRLELGEDGGPLSQTAFHSHARLGGLVVCNYRWK